MVRMFGSQSQEVVWQTQTIGISTYAKIFNFKGDITETVAKPYRLPVCRIYHDVIYLEM